MDNDRRDCFATWSRSRFRTNKGCRRKFGERLVENEVLETEDLRKTRKERIESPTYGGGRVNLHRGIQPLVPLEREFALSFEKVE
jgi:hypothetical protein